MVKNRWERYRSSPWEKEAWMTGEVLDKKFGHPGSNGWSGVDYLDTLTRRDVKESRIRRKQKDK